MNLEDLLKEWSEQEPDRCRYDEQDGEWMVMTAICWSCLPDPELAPSDIQGAVQQSIEARGWQWELHGSKSYSSAVVKHISINMKIKDADTCAHALLSAYLQAIKQAAEVTG